MTDGQEVDIQSLESDINYLQDVRKRYLFVIKAQSFVHLQSYLHSSNYDQSNVVSLSFQRMCAQIQILLLCLRLLHTCCLCPRMMLNEISLQDLQDSLVHLVDSVEEYVSCRVLSHIFDFVLTFNISFLQI